MVLIFVELIPPQTQIETHRCTTQNPHWMGAGGSAGTKFPLHLLVQEGGVSRDHGAALRPQVACQHDHFQVIAILRHAGLRRKLNTELVGNNTIFLFEWWGGQGLVMYLKLVFSPPTDMHSYTLHRNHKLDYNYIIGSIEGCIRKCY